LSTILQLLAELDLKAIFFITGHMAERLEDFPNTVDLLNEHEIGYHSSSHSVHPTIFEYTDIADYDEAYSISIKRETSHINPLTGNIEGKGGLLFLKELFPAKSIVAYRAPGCCWSPPHTEALRDLGINFDFSSAASSSNAVSHKGITFYPYPILGSWNGSLRDYRFLGQSVLKNEVTVTGFHPSLLVSENQWDSIYHRGNPKHTAPPKPREPAETQRLVRDFELFLRRMRTLEKAKLAQITAEPRASERKLKLGKEMAERCYQRSMIWAHRWFNYDPKFLHNHFLKFYEQPIQHLYKP
jgi:hypothetical protein